MGPFVNSSHMMDIVHFQYLNLTCHGTDPHLLFYISYDAFQLLFPWLRNTDSEYSISQKLMDRGRNWPKMHIFLEDMHAVQLKPIIMWISSKTIYIYNSYDLAQGQGHQF